MPDTPILKLGLVDDHNLFRRGLIALIRMALDSAVILFEASNGLELRERIRKEDLPDIIIMDVAMPKFDGFESTQWLRENHPAVKVIVISMINTEASIVRMASLGVRGYLCKDVEIKELGEALLTVHNNGYYYTDFLTGRLVHPIGAESDAAMLIGLYEQLNEKERIFLQLACSELTIEQIAARMHLSPKAVEWYRSSVFEKLNVKNRLGMLIYAVKNGHVTL